MSKVACLGRLCCWMFFWGGRGGGGSKNPSHKTSLQRTKVIGSVSMCNTGNYINFVSEEIWTQS